MYYPFGLYIVNLNLLICFFFFLIYRFDDTNSEKLRRATHEKETNSNTLFLDPKDINWENYFVNVHLPGLVKYAIK